MALMLVGSMTAAMAQNADQKGTKNELKPAQIKFEKTTHNFGSFSEKNPVVTCTFSYTNIGACGCTVPEYTKTPVQPGDKGEIKVTYNGEGKFPGHFKKSITIRTNGAVEMTRLYIEGDMTEAEK